METRKQTPNPVTSIDLNGPEISILASYLDTIRRADEAREMFQKALSGIVMRAGGETSADGKWGLSNDLRRAVFIPNGEANAEEN